MDIIEAGVDPAHQEDHCDHCGYVFSPEMRDDLCMIRTTERFWVEGLGTYGYRAATLCFPCYKKMGNSVR